MIVLSVGMPRAGSGWHYNLINDLMKTTGCADARDIREKYRLQNILTEVNCNIGVLSLRRLAMVTLPAVAGNTFVIKAHAGPTFWSRALSSFGMLRTYIFRDPRDAMLSAFDYGQRALEKGRPNAFSHIINFEAAIQFMEGYLKIWDKWNNENHVHISRYEDLLMNYESETAQLIDFLRLDRSKPAVDEVLQGYRPSQAQSQQGLHFYKGKIGRFRKVYSEQQQKTLVERFRPYLVKMGYEQ